MHLLLTNDDGILAPGLRALADALTSAGHRISVCAPDRERSAASHSITLGRPLSAAPADYPGAVRAWQVDGTPADCASLGLWLTRDDPADMVVAGINFGMNLGGAAVYSGTVAAAMEASMCGTPGLAVSLCVKSWNDPADFGAAARLAADFVGWVAAHPLPLGCLYSLNVPSLPWAQIRGIRSGRLAPVFLGAPNYEPDGPDTYRFTHNNPVPMDDPEGDVGLVEQGYATVTKLTWDMRMNDEGTDEVYDVYRNTL